VNVEDDVLGNHLIRNIRALVLGGTSFGSADLTRRGIELLRRELPEQVLRDGGHYERSPSYHLVVLRDLLEIQAASPHSWLADAIARMGIFAAALARPDGAPALFNDGTVDAPRLELRRRKGRSSTLPRLCRGARRAAVARVPVRAPRVLRRARHATRSFQPGGEPTGSTRAFTSRRGSRLVPLDARTRPCASTAATSFVCGAGSAAAR
jgi:hypothetical protein